MSSYYAAHYGSGLKLNEEEFEAFVDRYMEANKTSKEETVKAVYKEWKMKYDDDDDADSEFNDMITTGDIYFTWSSDMSSAEDGKREFQPNFISPDECDGMMFQPYRLPSGMANVPYLRKDMPNPDFIEFESCRSEISYFFFSEKELDTIEAFTEKPYGSYEEFKQEFKDKMKVYLPEDFDWDAHIGRFSYALYA